jgi:hypothetical protein
VLLLCAALFVGAAATTAEFYRVNPTAGKLMLPYLAFVGYANALNYWFWKHNPDVSRFVCIACQWFAICTWQMTSKYCLLSTIS